MYAELFIRPEAIKGQIIYPDDARRLLGAALGKTAVPPLFFNKTEEGKSYNKRFYHPDPENLEAKLPYPPMVSFNGGKGFIRVYGIGQVGVDLIKEVAPIVATAVSNYYNSPYTFSLNEGVCELKSINTPKLYHISRMVTQKLPKKSEHFYKKNPTEIHDELRTIVAKGLLSRAKYLDEVNGTNLANQIPDLDSLGFHVFDGKNIPVKFKDVWFQGAAALTFSMNLDIQGPWQAGGLQSYGYGMIKQAIARGGR